MPDVDEREAGDTPMIAIRLARIAPASDASEHQMTVPVSLVAGLREALRPGAEVTRHRKIWRMGQVADVPGRENVVTGKIGYDESRLTTAWDPTRNDFVDADVREGTAFPFALDLNTGGLAYQAATSAGILSAFQAILNQAGGRWRVERIVEARTWPEWRSTVTRVTKLHLVLRRPNPNYAGRERVQALLEDAHAATLTLVATAAPNDLEGIDLEAEYIRQAIDHVEKGYGKLVARGEQHVGDTEIDRRYSSESGGVDRIAEVPTTDDGTASVVALADTAATVEVGTPTEAVEDSDAEDE